MFDLDAALLTVVEMGGSDLHLKVPSPPLVRLHGGLLPIPDTDRLRPEDTERRSARDAHRRDQLERFRRERRGRLLLHGPGPRALPRERLPPARLDLDRLPRHPVPDQAPSRSCCLPPVIAQLADEERGIILVTGTTGSGKSTTLAAMVDHINTQLRQAHRHDRGPDRVPAQRQAARSSTSARSASTRRPSRTPCAACCARTPT